MITDFEEMKSTIMESIASIIRVLGWSFSTYLVNLDVTFDLRRFLSDVEGIIQDLQQRVNELETTDQGQRDKISDLERQLRNIKPEETKYDILANMLYSTKFTVEERLEMFKGFVAIGGRYDEIIEDLHGGRWIEAIKVFRANEGQDPGLKASKDVIDALRSIIKPDPKPTSGCDSIPF